MESATGEAMMDEQYFLDAGFSSEEAAALVSAFQQLDRAARRYAKLRATLAIYWNPECQCYRERPRP
jgi:hypothetical protein